MDLHYQILIDPFMQMGAAPDLLVAANVVGLASKPSLVASSVSQPAAFRSARFCKGAS